MAWVDQPISAIVSLDKFCGSSLRVLAYSYQVCGLFYSFFGLFVCFDNLWPFKNFNIFLIDRLCIFRLHNLMNKLKIWLKV